MLKVNGKLFSMHPWLNWIERLATDQEVAGSNPSGCTPLRFTAKSKQIYTSLRGAGKDV